MTNVIKERVKQLNRHPFRKGSYVLYWMQQSQRAEYNHALEYAIRMANDLELPVVVCFGLTDSYPSANLRHYAFMLEGLQLTQDALAESGVKMVIQRGEPADVAVGLSEKAALVVCDRGYLDHQKAWRRRVSYKIECPVVQVESDVVVPVEVVSNKAEYAARTIRAKIHKHIETYLKPFRHSRVNHSSVNFEIESLDLSNIDAVLKTLNIDRSVAPVTRFFKGGTAEGKKRFKAFLKHSFAHYVDNRNQPQTDDISHMSPYLHFGQISPVYLALKVAQTASGLKKAQDAYLEELIVRRELAINFVHYNPNYRSFKCLPKWARQTLIEHRKDERIASYTRKQLESAQTHDAYWNAAMREMKITGFMHNYMRMYWGKKILEWSKTPEHAFRVALELNNKYFLDGRDANSYAGVAWVFGMHDRAWFERSIFGKIRYMAASGLERKCDINGYVAKVSRLESRA